MRGTASGVLALLLALIVVSEAQAVDLSGLKGLGGSAGTSLVVGDWQFRTNSRPRLTGDFIFKWGWTADWALVGQGGFHWNGYGSVESWLSDPDLKALINLPTDRDVSKVSSLAPFTVGVERRFGSKVTVPYIGAGVGVYVQTILLNRSPGIDPRTGAKWRTTSPGVYGRVGIEQFMSDKISLDYDALYHVIFSEDRETFPDPTGADLAMFGNDFRSYGGNAQWVQIRFGIRYYWGGDN